MDDSFATYVYAHRKYFLFSTAWIVLPKFDLFQESNKTF